MRNTIVDVINLSWPTVVIVVMIVSIMRVAYIIRSDRRIKSFLSGCFMGSGSVNDPNKTNYHLEMAFVDETFAKEVLRLIEKINLSPKIIKRI